MYTLPRSIGSQSAGWQTGRLLARSRIWGRKLAARFAVCKTIRIAASTSCGIGRNIWLIASSPPAEAPMTTMSRCSNLRLPLPDVTLRKASLIFIELDPHWTQGAAYLSRISGQLFGVLKFLFCLSPLFLRLGFRRAVGLLLSLIGQFPR